MTNFLLGFGVPVTNFLLGLVAGLAAASTWWMRRESRGLRRVATLSEGAKLEGLAHRDNGDLPSAQAAFRYSKGLVEGALLVSGGAP